MVRSGSGFFSQVGSCFFSRRLDPVFSRRSDPDKTNPNITMLLIFHLNPVLLIYMDPSNSNTIYALMQLVLTHLVRLGAAKNVPTPQHICFLGTEARIAKLVATFLRR